MCGIAGIITPNAQQYKDVLKKMTNSLEHRGPDEEGFEFFDAAALGHRRLSIIDLTPTGRQPMYSNTQKQCLVLNGEIYGYQDLKKEFIEYPYVGTSDTELILAMYQKLGIDMIHKLPGMFAYALWDEQKQQLFCARDRFGEKPFYYAIGNNGEFIFASEIKAILASNLLQPKIDKKALAHYLKVGYVNPNTTIYSNIKIVPPAHFLVYKEGNIKIKRYYKIPNTTHQSINKQEAIEKFQYLLHQSIEKQMIADVPVGAFLSGGLDSSTIVAIASEYTSQLTTISYGYQDKKRNELPFAKEIAQKYNTNHIEILDDPQDISELLLTINKKLDEPFYDTSTIPTYLITKAAAEHLKVVLTGDVGDELFGGYTFYKEEYELLKAGSLPSLLSPILSFCYQIGKKMQKSRIVNFSRENLYRSKYSNFIDFHLNHVRNYFTSSEINLLGLEYTQPNAENFSFSFVEDNINTTMNIDMEQYVPGNMLVKADRMAMLNSLETRTPFLDTEFVEFCLQLPSSLKVSDVNDKIILREASQNYWTDSIKKRRKQGFGHTISQWLEKSEFQQLTKDYLQNKDAKIYDFLPYNQVQKHINYNHKHWNLLNLSIWLENKKTFL